MNNKIGSVLVVGGGIGGIQVVLDLSNAGFKGNRSGSIRKLV